ncbi:MAG: chromosomal replication initiator protein DnaA [Phycisphaerales bacterium]|nr:MAG: chromosomal replication initiator protein DnaA [Phycisphaerales bacterium]
MTVCATDMVCLLESRIAEKVGPQRFKVWFKNATRLTLADGFLKVDVPNQFVGGWIENHFSEIIRQAAEEVTGQPVSLSFSIDPSLARTLRKKQPDSQVDYAAANPERLARIHRRKGGPPPGPPLRARFDNFVVGESNRLAYHAARTVADQPASQYNPLFIHGGCGVGKTHLLQSVCNAVKDAHPDLNWVYVSGEDFTNQFVYAVKTGALDAFRHRYRSVDVLVVDDIHFFANKRATQDEFLHTFNAIDAAGKQVVMASDAPPMMVGHLSESLVNRFVAGMVVKVGPPDLQIRTNFLQQRAQAMNVHVPEPVIRYVAEVFQANIRELEGALLKLVALARLGNQPLTLQLAERGIRDLVQHTVPVVRLSDIESISAIFFGLTPADLHTSRKTRTIALARSVAMFLARKHTNMSFPEIARHMGNKNHTTVILAARRVKRMLEEDAVARWMAPAGEKQMKIAAVLTQLESQLGKPGAVPQPALQPAPQVESPCTQPAPP